MVRVLSVHAGYGCRHSGACCTAGWPIAVEPDRLARWRGWTPDQLVDGDDPPLLRVVDHACVCFDRGSRRCRVHSALGHGALPLACRQFPRVVVVDPRGASVVLSHFCPTAAGMITESDSEVAILENPPGFPADGEYVGLDTRDALPPLLRPDVLMDWNSWWEFEARAVALIGRSRTSAPDTLRRLSAIVEEVRAWKPGEGALRDRIAGAFDRSDDSDSRGDDDPARAVQHRFLAAHAFGSWIAHLGGGLRTWHRSLDAALSLAERDGIRQADLRLRHLEDTWALARRWSAEAEGHPATAGARRYRRAGHATRSSAR